jgi:hypothetical protein
MLVRLPEAAMAGDCSSARVIACSSEIVADGGGFFAKAHEGQAISPISNKNRSIETFLVVTEQAPMRGAVEKFAAQAVRPGFRRGQARFRGGLNKEGAKYSPGFSASNGAQIFSVDQCATSATGMMAVIPMQQWWQSMGVHLNASLPASAFGAEESGVCDCS